MERNQTVRDCLRRIVLGVLTCLSIWAFGDYVVSQSTNYGYVGYFHEGVAVAQREWKPFMLKNNYGYINEEGNIVIEFRYKYANDFHEGLAAVTEDWKKFGYIDHEGKWKIEPQYDYAGDFHNGEARVQMGIHHYDIDTEGNILREVKGG